MKVLILGASSDIGLAVCEIYLSKGWSVLAHYRTSCLELQRLVNENPDRIELIKLEFEIPNDLEAYIQCNQDKICECDALINCAAMYAPDKFSKLTSSNLIHTFSVNVIPGLIFMKNMAPKMTERNWGRIVNLSSIGVKYGGGNTSFSYSLSKHALEFITADHLLWASSNLLVNTLRIGVTNTRIHLRNPSKLIKDRVGKIPIGRMADTGEIAQAIYFFGSEENSYMTGQTISIAGGE